MTPLRKSLIRLAHQNPQYRKQLLPLIKEAAEPYDVDIDHGYDQPLAGGTDVMKSLQNQLLIEQGSAPRQSNPKIAAWNASFNPELKFRVTITNHQATTLNQPILFIGDISLEVGGQSLEKVSFELYCKYEGDKEVSYIRCNIKEPVYLAAIQEHVRLKPVFYANYIRHYVA